MKPFIITLILSSFLSLGCNNNNNPGQTAKTDSNNSTSSEKPVPQADDSRNALDWAGTYKGILPCADCSGIETILRIANDSTYSLTTTYLGKDKSISNEASGKFSWNSNGSTITLDGINGRPNKYLVGENKLLQLDMNGVRISGENASKYELTKQ